MGEDVLIGRHLDEYRLEELLGRGGMARVYRAFDTRLKRWVAIKIIATPFRSDSDYMFRFEREAQAIAQLEHPNVVSVYRYGEVDDMLYIAMQYVEGMGLETLLRTYQDEGDYIPSADALKIIRDVCRALDYIHSKGVIHRDIKPANIMLNKEGQAILADFGLALLESAGTRGEIFGTPHYIAPEQAISSAGVVAQSDLYALGVIMYEMFTGIVPFDADSAMGIAMQHMSEPPNPPRQVRSEISPEVEAVILKALEKEPENRYSTGARLIAVLEKALQARQITSTYPVAPHRRSVMDRVALDLAERPLPPMPAGVSAAKSEPETQAQAVPDVKEETAKPPSPAKESSPMLYALVGAVATVLIVGLCGLGILWRFGILANTPVSDKQPANQALTNNPTSTLANAVVENTPPPAPTEAMPTTESNATPTPIPTAIPVPAPTETPAAVPPPSTSSPTDTPTPLPRPTDTPIPPLSISTNTPTALPTDTPTSESPQPIADTKTNFSGSQGASNWEYQWSKGRESFDWARMQFDGECWRTDNTESSVRTCRNSAHPGVTGDIAWRWTSTVSERVWIQVSAYKLDTGGGDGVDIVVYHNTAEVKRWHLGWNDNQGFSDGLALDIAQGDYIFFVMKIGGDPTYDHTAFRAQIYP